jgi:preprotein translocase subunit SecE
MQIEFRIPMASLISQNQLWQELFSAQQYKPGQGARARWGTFAVLAIIVVLGGWSWKVTHTSSTEWVRWGVPFVGVLLGFWFSYRLIHYPRFADFLIATEAEMNKVSWPSKLELKSSTIVVLIFVVSMAAFLFLVDFFWRFLLRDILGILKFGGFTPVG